jgi:glutathione S-transferase
MRLYGTTTSPYVRHCRVALLDCGFPFELVPTDHAQSKNLSPTARVPFLEDGNVRLTDSTSILFHVRKKANQPFIETAEKWDSYCLANTTLDAGITLFLIERLDGSLPESKYVRRQSDRLASCLDELARRTLPHTRPLDDSALRIACLLEWGLFRQRFSLEQHEPLMRFLELARSWEPFAQTAPEKS